MRYLTFIIGLILMSGCSLFEDASPEIAISIHEELSLQLWEELDPDQNQFKVLLSPLSPDCPETEIHYDVNIQNRNIFLRLLGIQRPDICDSLIQTPTTDVNLEIHDGKYGFILQIGDNLIHQGFLKRSIESYQLQLNTSDGIVIDHTTLRRIPEETIWGYVHSTQTGENEIQQFFLELESITKQSALQSGYYGYFEIDGKQQAILHNTSSNSGTNIFIRQLTSPEKSLSTLIQNWRISNPDLEIFCKTWQGTSL